MIFVGEYMKNNYFLRTLNLIYKNAPMRFLLSIGTLILISSFPLLNLMATNALITQMTARPLQIENLVIPSLAFIISLLLINSKSFMNLLGSYIWITAEIALQRALIQKASNKSLIFFDTPSFYQDLEKAKEGYGHAIGTTMMLISAIFISLLSVVLLAGYLAQIDWRITIALVLIVCIKIIAYGVETRNLQGLRSKQAGEIKKCDLLSSYLWTKETRVYGASMHFLSKWFSLKERLTKEKFITVRKNLWISFVLDCFTYACYASIMILVVRVQLQRDLASAAVSGIVVLFVAMDSIFLNINTVIIQFGNFMKNASLSKDLFDFLSSPDAPDNLKKISSGDAVCLKNVSFRYPSGKKDALHKINLSIQAGENIAIVGKNGSGKSTLVKLLCGLYEPTEGTVCYGHSLQLSENSHQNITTMFQNVNTYHLTLVENILISETQKEGHKERAEEILSEVMGEQWLSKYSEGGATMVGRPFGGIELSGGEKQRLSLGRTLFRTSTLMFFDEPTSALDPLAEDRLYQDIVRSSQGKTTFFITHRLSSVRFADRIIVLDHGEIVEEGSYKELMKENRLFASMYIMQKQGLQ